MSKCSAYHWGKKEVTVRVSVVYELQPYNQVANGHKLDGGQVKWSGAT